MYNRRRKIILENQLMKRQ